MLGTTEHIYSGDPASVSVLAEEEQYLLEVMSRYFPDRSQQVIARFAGLRVLPVSGHTAFKASRETQLPADDPQHPRTIAIFGGKLTGYRATAEKIINKLRRTLPERKQRAATDELPLKPV